MTATLNILSRNFVEGYSSYLILASADNGKYKVFEETDSNLHDTELEAVTSALKMAEKMGWRTTYIYCYPNICKWGDLLRSNKPEAQEFKEVSQRLGKTSAVRLTGRPDNAICKKMANFLERRAVELGVIE